MAAECERRRMSTLALIAGILSRRARVRLGVAAVVSGLLAVVETLAILSVLPLVSLATGAPLDEGALGNLWMLLGRPERSTYGLLLVALVVALFVVKDACSIVFNWWQLGFVARERVDLSTRIFRTVMLSPYVDYRKRSSGEIFRTVAVTVGQVFSSVVNGLVSMISAGLSVLAILVALIATTPVQALIALVYFSVGAAAYIRFVRPRVSQAGERMTTGWTELTIGGLQGLNGFKEVSLRGSAEHFVRRFSRGVEIAEGAGREGNFFGGVTKYLLEILFIVGIGILLVVSFLHGTSGQAIGSLGLFVAAGFRLLPNISLLVSAITSLRLGRSPLEIVHEELRTEQDAREVQQRADTQPLPFEESVVLDGVGFRYPGAESDVLDGVDLRIPFGHSIAVVGGSGAGKTTLVDLLLGLLQPTSGSIRVDGTAITGEEPAWQKNVAMVAQDVYLSEESVLRNILFDEPPEQAHAERLQAAISEAQLDDLVASLPQGLDTPAGDGGSRLSGGQRQRVGIARALYTDPRLLVLDEATSALDNETERRITRTIETLTGSVTVIVVAHRLSTVKHVDEIVFLQDGKIAGRGTFAELRDGNEDFAHLVRLGDLGGGGAAVADRPDSDG